MRQKDALDVAKGAVAGIIGGLLAAFVMSEFQALVTKIAETQEEPKKKKTKKEKEDDEPATAKVAARISEGLFDHKLTKDEKKIADPAMHYAMGAASGMMYGVAAEIAPLTTVGAGLPFGASVWLVADDIVVPALGLSKPVTEFPFSTHLYGLSSHLVYGLTTDLVRRAVRELL